MKMNLRQSYLAMFYLLDGYYEKTKNDVLGMILGSLNPYLFSDEMPADQAAWVDWKDCIQQAFNKENLSSKEALQAVAIFLDFYQREFGYDLNWLLIELKNNQSTEKWKDFVQKAINAE